jgi:hypothetical protein
MTYSITRRSDPATRLLGATSRRAAAADRSPPGVQASKDAGEEMVIAACRRVIAADRIGWRKHGDPADLELVYSFHPDA